MKNLNKLVSTFAQELSLKVTESVDSDFNKRLCTKFPYITRNEKILCMYLKMYLNLEEIANIMGKKKHTIEVARVRLRKKLGITNSTIYLNSFIELI